MRIPIAAICNNYHSPNVHLFKWHHFNKHRLFILITGIYCYTNTYVSSSTTFKYHLYYIRCQNKTSTVISRHAIIICNMSRCRYALGIFGRSSALSSTLSLPSIICSFLHQMGSRKGLTFDQFCLIYKFISDTVAILNNVNVLLFAVDLIIYYHL